jgi:hypothetical protein
MLRSTNMSGGTSSSDGGGLCGDWVDSVDSLKFAAS